MREIKFRAWDKDDKVMWSHNVIETYAHTQGESAFDIITRDFSNMVIMQYTGLNDKTGKEIYEGDIMADENKKCAVSVVWSNQTAGFGVDFISGGGTPRLSFLSKRLSIIGNIYENPELLNI